MRLWKWQKQIFTDIKKERSEIIPGKIGRVRSMLIIENDKEQRNTPKNTRSVYYLKQKRVRERREKLNMPPGTYIKKDKKKHGRTITFKLTPPTTIVKEYDEVNKCLVIYYHKHKGEPLCEE